MAKMELQLPDDVMKEFKEINDNADEIFGGMTRAGAEVVWHNVKIGAPSTEIAQKFKLSKTYKTPSDGGINTKVYCSGYIPFSDPNRKYFSRYAKGRRYDTTKGVPVAFLATLYEYGRKGAPFPKSPFLRPAFKEQQITSAMLKAQSKLSKGLLDEGFNTGEGQSVPFL